MFRPDGAAERCYHETALPKSHSFEDSYVYYSQYFNETPKLIYDYWLKSDLQELSKRSKTLPRNIGSSVVDSFKGPKVFPRRNVCFYGLEDTAYRACPHRTFIVKADIEPNR
ncbi:hypothetical protein EVAR_81421_1 [Eumeta japonica]|uniref:Uncharacterized protein n=1 Tax=Eumeta variegata TaxID=151549 RepID=A0A4C1WF87_EUMVA|nr:hypothetical protein EVAR_81421_1 [Eumeta japonica]